MQYLTAVVGQRRLSSRGGACQWAWDVKAGERGLLQKDECTMKLIRTISGFFVRGGVLELTSRFGFDFRRCRILSKTIRFFVQSHGLFAPTQFHFECCCARDGS